MTIEIFGPSDPNCAALAANARIAADKLGVHYELCRVTNQKDIAAHGVRSAPARGIDGRIRSAGKVLDAAEMTTLLASALA